MAIIAKVKQQPNDVQDYDIDFSEWFPEGDLITWAVCTAAPVMETPNTVAIDPTKRIVKVWVYAGGVSGTDYKLTIRATTTDTGSMLSAPLRVKEVEMIVKIREI